MSQKKKQKKDKEQDSRKTKVDIDQLKSFGITQDPSKGGIEEVDGSEISGGKKDADTTVDTHWPTTGSA